MSRALYALAALLLVISVLAGSGCSLDLGDAVDKAREQDDRKRYEKQVWCPKCGSSSKRQTDIGKVGNVLGSGMLYKCKKCGHKYQ